ncbi:hypothetical protein Q5762_09335 [Streptomyces sp. P9(2023)]|uniref:hypothetical protein n=1 Tax=Streptomyces sp. P9(2023) TaxID=3064394 RepID=UPI0028F3EA94|nr:hypothetical protein [Streptomyces sp. P9(2023)]MDT9688551.1 hypothetical protein [Streptomyces sp. P9(2023)]
MDFSEESVRRGLRDLADGDAGPAPVGKVVARGRRIRHVRRSLAAGAATLVVTAGAVVLGVRWTDPAPSPLAPPPPGPTAPSYPYDGKYPPQPPSGDHDPLDTGPRAPVENTRYRYDLSAVCDLRYAVFGGRLWERADGGSSVAVRWAGDRLRGYMSWTDGRSSRSEPDTAVFETDPPAALPALRFRPLAGPAPECLGQEPARRHGDAPAGTLGPERPEPGVRYPYDMTKECEMRYAVFAGRLWRAESDGSPQTIIDWVNDLPLPAFMTLTSERTAVLEWPAGVFETPRTSTYRPVETRGDDCA